MKVPTIHLNGTSRDRLIEDLSEAYYALGKAMSALRVATPNGRDYYPQGPQAYGEALDEHLARLGKIEEVRKELEALIEGIDKAGR